MCFAPSPYPRSPERFSAQAQIIPSKPLVREGGGGRREKRGEHDGRAGVEEASTEDDRESIVKCEQSAACHTSHPIPYTKELAPQFEVEAPPTPTPTQAQVKATTKVHSEALSQETLSQPATSEHVIVQQERKTESVSPRLLLPLLPLQQDEKTVFIKRTEGTSSSLPDARHQDISHVTKLQDTRLQDTRLQDTRLQDMHAQPSEKRHLFDRFVEADLAAFIVTPTCQHVVGGHPVPDQTAPNAPMAPAAVSTHASKACGVVLGAGASWVDNSDLCPGRTGISTGSQRKDPIMFPLSTAAAGELGAGDCAGRSSARTSSPALTTPRFAAVTPFAAPSAQAAGQIAASAELAAIHTATEAVVQRPTASGNGVALKGQQVLPTHGAGCARASASWFNADSDAPALVLHTVKTASKSIPLSPPVPRDANSEIAGHKAEAVSHSPGGVQYVVVDTVNPMVVDTLDTTRSKLHFSPMAPLPLGQRAVLPHAMSPDSAAACHVSIEKARDAGGGGDVDRGRGGQDSRAEPHRDAEDNSKSSSGWIAAIALHAPLSNAGMHAGRAPSFDCNETSAKWNSKLGAERGRSAWHGKSGVATTQSCVASARQASVSPIGSNISNRDNKRRSRSVGARKPRPPPLSAMAKAMASAGAVYAPPFEGAMSSNGAASNRGSMAVENKERAEMPRQDIRKAPRDTGKRDASLTHDHLTSQRDHCRQKIVAEYHHHETHPASPAPPAPAAPSTQLPPPRTPNDQVEKAEWVKEDVTDVQESWMPSPVVATLEVLRLSLELFVAHVFVSSCAL